jgi:hypothetical protein
MALWGGMYTFGFDDPFVQLGGIVMMCTAILCFLGSGILARLK